MGHHPAAPETAEGPLVTIAELRDVLRAIEWSGAVDHGSEDESALERACPWCGSSKDSDARHPGYGKHATDCALAAALKGGAAHGDGLAETERAAWARYVDAVIDERDAQIAFEREQMGAADWLARTEAARKTAEQTLRDLGVNVDELLKGAT